nr:malectin-like carbohydrate-binding domain-containing protein [Tanacetum cinerariifolium]
MAGHFKLLPVVFLLALFIFSVSGQLIASINCGASDPITDSNLITWTPDDTLVSNGDARVVQSSNLVPSVMDTLRVFTSRKKNCYSVPVTKGEKVLVRASFNYENYDRLSKPPMFDLHFDGNLWATVQTTMSGFIYYEVTYVTKGDTASVCVAKTKPNQFPFISALEFRSVDSEVYKEVDENQALFLIARFAYGASQTIRYPSDPYDRMWVSPQDVTDTVTSEVAAIDPTTPDNAPLEIFQNAMTSTTDSFIVTTLSPSYAYYINTYYSEVSNLDSSQTRSFNYYETSSSGSHALASDSFSPPYGTVLERYLYNYTVDSVTNITLTADVDSDLPPLINAIEVFNIGDVLTDGTHSDDVAALTLLQNTFDVLGGWSGDPCLPAPYSWDWLNCSNDATPRVISLYLDSFNLSGSLPDISSMDALEIIDLHANSLTGTIPSFLGTMPELQQLNLANNQFSGPIPTSLAQNKNLKLVIDGNPSLCTTGKPCSSSPGTDSSPGSTRLAKSKKSSTLPVVLGITIPAFFLIWVAAGVFIILRRRKMRANKPDFTGAGANGNSNGLQKFNEQVGNATGNSNGLQKFDEQAGNATMDTEVQQTFSSPSPLLHTSGDTND